jgi:hypothetical protein
VFWMIALSTLGCLVVLFLFRERDQQAVRRDWEQVLTQREMEEYIHSHSRFRMSLKLFGRMVSSQLCGKRAK